MSIEKMNIPTGKNDDPDEPERREFLKKTAQYTGAGVATYMGIKGVENAQAEGIEEQEMTIELARNKFNSALGDLVRIIDQSEIKDEMQDLISGLREDIKKYLDGSPLDSDSLSEFGENLIDIKSAQEQRNSHKELRKIGDAMRDVEAIMAGLAPLGILENDERKKLFESVTNLAIELQNVELVE